MRKLAEAAVVVIVLIVANLIAAGVFLGLGLLIKDTVIDVTGFAGLVLLAPTITAALGFIWLIAVWLPRKLARAQARVPPAPTSDPGDSPASSVGVQS